MQPDRRQRDRAALGDMLDAMRVASEHVAGLRKETAGEAPHPRDACLYRILVLGEAATRISVELQNEHSEVPWCDIIGMRNVPIHGYEKVNWDVVWGAVQEDFPRLRNQIAAILRELE